MKKLVKTKGDKVIASINFKGNKKINSKSFEEKEVEKGEDGLYYLLGKAPSLSNEERNRRFTKKAKKERTDYVSRIVVEVDGMRFDGDETSQDRMVRAAYALNDGETVQWVLADNTIAQVTKEQLRQALRLAGEAQTAIWANPYLQ